MRTARAAARPVPRPTIERGLMSATAALARASLAGSGEVGEGEGVDMPEDREGG